MARQVGFGKFAGMLNDIIFKAGKTAHMKGKDVSNGIKNTADERFARTRENIAEFGRAGNAGKLIRDALRTQIKLTGGRAMVTSLFAQFMRVVKADPINDRGKRTVHDGPVELLEGYDFNQAAQLNIIFPVVYTTAINHAAGEFAVEIPEFIPKKVMKVPAGATHFRLTALAVELDFKEDRFTTKAFSTSSLPWDMELRPPLSMALTLDPDGTKPVFLVLAIEYEQLVNQKFYPITSAEFNAIRIIRVSIP